MNKHHILRHSIQGIKVATSGNFFVEVVGYAYVGKFLTGGQLFILE